MPAFAPEPITYRAFHPTTCTAGWIDSVDRSSRMESDVRAKYRWGRSDRERVVLGYRPEWLSLADRADSYLSTI